MVMKKSVIVALDSNNLEKINNLVDKIKEHIFGVKIGYEFFLNFGLEGYKIINDKKINIFLDLKLHDIPNTIKNGIKSITDLNPYFTSIHISGGDEMQKIAVLNKKNVKILGISILTSMDAEQTKKYYNLNNIEEVVGKFVKYATNNKLDGVVCSPHEIKLIKEISKGNLIIVTPGIRPENYKKQDDQKRFMTPKEAMSNGADYIVIGRPITQSSDPLKEIKEINSTIE